MKGVFSKVVFPSLLIGFLFCALGAKTNAQNAINGIVFDENRKPLPNVEVELLDSFERLIGSRTTRGGGFYTFQRLNQGIYYIKVRVGGTNYLEKKRRIDLGDLNSIGGVDIKQIDVFMEIDPRGKKGIPANTGVVFVQNIPAEAKILFDQAVNDVRKKKVAEAENKLIKSLSIFPDYYDALLQLGDLYLSARQYLAAEKALKAAVAVNSKSEVGHFGLAVAQNNSNKKTDAIANLNKAIELNSNSENSLLMLGMIHRDIREFDKAEANFLKVKKLTGNTSADTNWQLALLYYHDLKNKAAAAVELNSYLQNLSKADKKKNPEKVKTVKTLIKKIKADAS